MPQNTDAYLHRANTYYGYHEYKKALADFEEYLKLKPDDIEVQYDKRFAEILARK